ncbi:DUF3040 domain-containing protein [Actinomycetospora straminea]|uniref:DUF3040 family protein n=1 Tax=Actinomycetospora straminea TaxID=663607 RepID=A0ABP9EIW2_9PSEU|nr:DUF3040 domain-containing protein [Actinomycetospora straminea]MDD7933132.1 DUF3040 domain-containing protein [Actinomycetospora straminea]
MPATPSTPGPQPDDSRPLSEREERVLSELEATTVDEDPALAARMRRAQTGRGDGIPSRTYNALIQIGIVFLLAVLVLPHPWGAGLVVFASMAIPSAIVLVALRRGAR